MELILLLLIKNKKNILNNANENNFNIFQFKFSLIFIL